MVYLLLGNHVSCQFIFYFALQDCLGIIYAVHMEGLPVSMETLVGNLMGYIQVPPAGGPQVSFWASFHAKFFYRYFVKTQKWSKGGCRG